jgi:hypothetical protein
MPRAPRPLLPPLAVVLAVGGTLLSGGRLRSAPVETALWIDGSNPACSDLQTRALDPARPYCSVARAASQAVAGDTVHVAPGRYVGTVPPPRGGTPDAPIRFVADGADTILDAAGAAQAIKLIGTGDVRFEGLEVTGGVNQGVWVDAADRLVLDHVRVRSAVRLGGARDVEELAGGPRRQPRPADRLRGRTAARRRPGRHRRLQRDAAGRVTSYAA